MRTLAIGEVELYSGRNGKASSAGKKPWFTAEEYLEELNKGGVDVNISNVTLVRRGVRSAALPALIWDMAFREDRN
jgi:hypothetical protein